MKFLLISSILAFGTYMALADPVPGLNPVECTRPFEKYDCGSACQTECKTLGQVCPIVNIRCNDDCYCIDGYARNAEGTCIPISQCKKT